MRKVRWELGINLRFKIVTTITRCVEFNCRSFVLFINLFVLSDTYPRKATCLIFIKYPKG
jgi:hypothetical protein